MAHTFDSGGFFTFLVALSHGATERSQNHEYGSFWPQFTFFPQFVSECASGNPPRIGKFRWSFEFKLASFDQILPGSILKMQRIRLLV